MTTNPVVPSSHTLDGPFATGRTFTNVEDATTGPPAPPDDASRTVVDFPFLGPPMQFGDLGRLGQYRVTKLLGEGGMGFVFRGEDDTLRRPVALKVMRPEIAGRHHADDRFLREGRAAAALKSDHIADIYFVGEHAGVPFLAMEFLEGQPLDVWLKARPSPVPVVAVVRVAKDVLKGLAAAHDKGLVHRDIKPANLWVEKGTGRVKVLDFGLTRGTGAGDQLTADGAVVGTPSYMAPEQAQGLPVDARTDLFSVGVVLYRMLAGKSPFARGDMFASLTALATETPRPVEQIAPGTPADLAALIASLMTKDPAGRPADARAALAEVGVIERRLRAELAAKPAAPVPAASPTPSTTVAVVVPEPANGGTRSGAATAATTVVPVRPRVRSRAGVLVAGGLLGLALVAAAGAVVVKITNPDGTVTEVKVPAGATVEVTDAGKTVAAVPPKPDTPPAPATPTVWVSTNPRIDRRFEKTGPAEWAEVLPGDRRTTFAEVAAGPEYVELHDAGRGVSYRLYPNRLMTQHPGSPYYDILAGGWGEKPVVPPTFASWVPASFKTGSGFAKTGPAEWTETLSDGRLVGYAEVAVTPEYVELHDAGRGISVRLYPNRVMLKLPGGTFTDFLAGRWETPPAAPNPPAWVPPDAHTGSRFDKTGPAEWTETQNDGVRRTFAEVAVTPEYIELRDGSRNLSARLYAAGRAGTLRQPGATNFIDWFPGRWEPKPAFPAALKSTRPLWVTDGDGSRFEKTGPAEWTETRSDGRQAKYAEAAVTPEFVELHDAGRNCTVRLEAAVGMLKQPPNINDFADYKFPGHWETKPPVPPATP